ncbi:uncharacterized protein [Miscanthus floridulus]|uniref:uncharacterized protein n=1 Tax=Miscanthus floridulus TaxID=154761 RepID=UPI00345AEF2D
MGPGAAGSGVGSPPSWGRHLAAERCTSTGATMSVAAHSAPVASVSGGCCSCGAGHGNCVNIYVNNNVQGVTNSVLVGSKVVMRDPGPRIASSRHHQPRRDGRCRRREGKRHQQLQHMAKTIKIGIVAVVVSSLLFLAAAATTILCLHLFVRVRE